MASLGSLCCMPFFLCLPSSHPVLPPTLHYFSPPPPPPPPPIPPSPPPGPAAASDLWALGCILYECAAGRPPFAASTTQQLNALIVGSHPPTPHGGCRLERVAAVCGILKEGRRRPIARREIVGCRAAPTLVQPASFDACHLMRATCPRHAGISPELVGLISRLLDKDPLQRCT